MAHPALAALITNFFYSSSSLNSAFPEVFSREVPKVAVCLVATAVWLLACFFFLHFPVYITHILHTASSCSWWVRSSWHSTRPTVRIHHLLEDFRRLFRHATSNRSSPEARCENQGVASQLGIQWEVCATIRNILSVSIDPEIRALPEAGRVIAHSGDFRVVLDWSGHFPICCSFNLLPDLYNRDLGCSNRVICLLF